MKPGNFGVVTVALLLANCAHGAISWVSQERSISGFVHAEWPGIPTEEASFLVVSPDFGVFEASRSITVAPLMHPHRRADAFAEQRSFLTDSLISATGRITAGTLGIPPEQYGLAECRFSVTFDVDVGSPFHLEGMVFLERIGALPTVGIAALSLTGPGVDVSRSLTSFGTLTVDEFGVLNPGRYTLEARTFADIRDAPTFYAEGRFSVSLSIIPAPASWSLLAPVAWLQTRRPTRAIQRG